MQAHAHHAACVGPKAVWGRGWRGATKTVGRRNAPSRSACSQQHVPRREAKWGSAHPAWGRAGGSSSGAPHTRNRISDSDHMSRHATLLACLASLFPLATPVCLISYKAHLPTSRTASATLVTGTRGK